MFQSVELQGLSLCKKQTPILQQGSQETSKRETVFSSTPQKIKRVTSLEKW